MEKLHAHLLSLGEKRPSRAFARLHLPDKGRCAKFAVVRPKDRRKSADAAGGLSVDDFDDDDFFSLDQSKHMTTLKFFQAVSPTSSAGGAAGRKEHSFQFSDVIGPENTQENVYKTVLAGTLER